VPIVSQHDLFFIPNLPKNSPRQPQNRSQDGLSDTLQSFFSRLRSTADWNASSDDGKWTVPIIFQISQILKIGKQPVSIQIGGKYYADTPRYGPNLGVRFNFTLLYPTGRHPEAVERAGLAK